MPQMPLLADRVPKIRVVALTSTLQVLAAVKVKQSRRAVMVTDLPCQLGHRVVLLSVALVRQLDHAWQVVRLVLVLPPARRSVAFQDGPGRVRLELFEPLVDVRHAGGGRVRGRFCWSQSEPVASAMRPR
ncbi:hypothetical protein [Kribbella sp. NPDC049584]|uniref:hypothetical protein n=1 Tax=Kribbella sp. NPDC049584 TaxID=3154833 RepID=UPI00343BEF68